MTAIEWASIAVASAAAVVVVAIGFRAGVLIERQRWTERLGRGQR